MNSRKAVDAPALALMTGLGMVWGLQQVALKASADAFSPMLQIALRSGIAAALVALLMAARGEQLALRGGPWRPGLAVGALFALEYLLVCEALRHTSAGHLLVFLYTAPVFAALGLHRRLPSERLRPLQWAGIALAMAGIAWAFLGRGAPRSAGSAAMLWGDLLGLLAGASWGATTVVLRSTRLAAAPASQTLLYQLLAAFVLLGAAAPLLGQARFEATPWVWSHLAFQAVIVSFASFLLWFRLLRSYHASQLGVCSFMTPLFGVAFGVWLLNEPLEPGFVAGAALVLAGIVLVSGHAWLGPRLGRLLSGPERAWLRGSP
ncbi:EamA family transporter [Rubrivivax sp. A210]|uniref:DMT family transporter n=1 Tax=Rubrivivax sp. A210 TaxID=2772301 RepID=UPI00191A086D|nr:DMT family transporter [Rubrivivax sp. A210]CAD5375179.1 EamA family transporter [Rubrivivax sp. A210]